MVMNALCKQSAACLRRDLLLIALALAVYVPGMAGLPLFDRDEGWYAQVSREMVQSGDWLVPTYLGEVWLAKPPLLYWLVGGSFSLFGVGTWQARLVPVLLGVLNVLLVARLGERVVGRGVGLWAGAIFVTMGLPAVAGRLVLTDGPTLTCILLAVLLHVRLADRGAGHLSSIGYWLAIGLGLLAKGPAIVLFAGAFGLSLMAAGRWRGWLDNWRFWLWLPLSPAVAGPWYAYIAAQAEGTFWSQFVGYEILSRLASAPHGHSGPPGYHLLIALAGLLPWTPLAIAAVADAFGRWRADRPGRLLLLWWLIPWLVLEIIRSKLPHYTLPAYVPLALLTARWLTARLPLPVTGHEGHKGVGRLASPCAASQAVIPGSESGQVAAAPDRRLRRGMILSVGLLLLFLVPVTVLAGVPGDGLALWPMVLGLVASFVWVAVAVVMLARSYRAATRFIVGGAAVFYLVLGFLTLPGLLSSVHTNRDLAGRLDALAGADTDIYIVNYAEPSVFFYLSRPATALHHGHLSALVKTLARHPGKEALIVIPAEKIPKLTDHVKTQLHLDHAHPELTVLNPAKMERERLILVQW